MAWCDVSTLTRRTIATIDGQLVDVWTVTHKDGVFRVDTIAHSLALKCRYGGQTSDANGNPVLYSVAEHCVLVEKIVEERTRWMMSTAMTNHHRLMLRREALVHDADEALLYDILAPHKKEPTFDAYRELESRLARELRLWFGVSIVESATVKDIDIEIRGTERRDLMGNRQMQWETAPPIEGIQCGTMTPLQAKTAWLAKFRELWPDFKE